MKDILSKIKMLEKVSYGLGLNEALTEFHQDFSTSLVKGRNVMAGTARAWGLQFGELGKALESDPVYQASFKLGNKETLLLPVYLQNLFLILKY